MLVCIYNITCPDINIAESIKSGVNKETICGKNSRIYQWWSWVSRMSTNRKPSFDCEFTIHFNAKHNVALDLLESNENVLFSGIFRSQAFLLKFTSYIQNLLFNKSTPGVSYCFLVYIYIASYTVFGTKIPRFWEFLQYFLATFPIMRYHFFSTSLNHQRKDGSSSI